MSKIKSQKAFTLIELLVVMAIIAILSAIMFGPIQTARRRSKDTQAVADMKIFQTYLQLWASEHKGFYPESLDSLSIYGPLPKGEGVKYIYIVFPPPAGGMFGDPDVDGGYKFYHLYTHLNDKNPAFDTDADCDSTQFDSARDNNFNYCWSFDGNAGGWSYSGMQVSGTVPDPDILIDGNEGNYGTPSPSVCRNAGACILDYTQNSN